MRSAFGLCSSVVMSRNITPGCGQSGTVRIWLWMKATGSSGAPDDECGMKLSEKNGARRSRTVSN